MKKAETFAGWPVSHTHPLIYHLYRFTDLNNQIYNILGFINFFFTEVEPGRLKREERNNKMGPCIHEQNNRATRYVHACSL